MFVRDGLELFSDLERTQAIFQVGQYGLSNRHRSMTQDKLQLSEKLAQKRDTGVVPLASGCFSLIWLTGPGWRAAMIKHIGIDVGAIGPGQRAKLHAHRPE